jgi:hypothetical protein
MGSGFLYLLFIYDNYRKIKRIHPATDEFRILENPMAAFSRFRVIGQNPDGRSVPSLPSGAVAGRVGRCSQPRGEPIL